MNDYKYTNRLISEKSPYLLQHAHNPVNWYSWNEEAFNKAKQENKLVFLSIGYSTCHWCHVMEKESFEDEDVAKILNNNYISIKVDREERPDIDHIYMEVCQVLNGHGGWPLTIIMTPDKKPFFAGTYFPKNTKGRYIGLVDILIGIDNEWKAQKDEILNTANNIVSIISESVDNIETKEQIDEEIFSRTYNNFKYTFDEHYGGFGDAPKFPSPHRLLFLLRYSVYKNDKLALTMVEKTLLQMYKGGIFDHLGYGFARYSTDRMWLVPHFEKMLYDNALLAITYLETYLATGNAIYKEVVDKILHYVSRDLTANEGYFYTAEDADSEGVEGKFYVWNINEIYEILSKEDADYVVNYYGLTKKGNFEGSNIINLINHDYVDVDNDRIRNIRERLFLYRVNRIHPYKDDKALTSWNGMMIVAFTLAGKHLNNKSYLEIAKKAADFINKKLFNDNGRLLARFRDNEAKYLGYLDDYAYYIYALIELFLATSKEVYLNQAIMLNTSMIELFYDHENGGFFYSGYDGEKLLIRNKELYDGAIPSGNSIVTMNLIRLAEITDDISYLRLAERQFEYFADKINSTPSAYTYMILTYLVYKQTMKKIVLVSGKEDFEFYDFSKIINSKYQPFSTSIMLVKDKIKDSKYFASYAEVKEDISLHICQDYTCEQPLFNKDQIYRALYEM